MQCEGQPFHMQTTTNHSLNRCSIIWDQEFWLKHLTCKILCFTRMVGAPETFTTYMLYGIGTIGPYLRRQGDPWPISSRSNNGVCRASPCTFQRQHIYNTLPILRFHANQTTCHAKHSSTHLYNYTATCTTDRPSGSLNRNWSDHS